MRARLAIKHAGIKVILREVVLRNKPPAMLAISPKGTVPVLQLPTGEVIDESWEIVHWATSINDSQSLRGSSARVLDANRLVSLNDKIGRAHV